MLKKSLSLLLVGSLIYAASAQPVLAQSTANKQDQVTEKVKAQILHLGVGEKSHVKVKLRNNTHVDGYISKAGEDSFEVTDQKTGAATSIAYQDVAQANGHNLSTGVKIAIGIGIAAAVFAVLIIIAASKGAFLPGA